MPFEPPFPIGHLHKGEQDRIRNGDLNPTEREMLGKGEDPWAKFRGPEKEPPQKDLGSKESDQGDLPLSTGTRVIGQTADEKTTPQQERDRKLRAFMSDPVRAAYDAADFEQREIIWAANERAFEEAEIRKEQKRLRDQQRMEKIFDALQRVKEDPDKAHLLPPDGASMPELEKWYEDNFTKPVRPVPFANPSEQHIRRDRMWRDIQRTGRADPEDIAEEKAEAERYRRKVVEAIEKKLGEIETERERAKPGATPDPKPLRPHGDSRNVGTSRDFDQVVAGKTSQITLGDHNQVVIASGNERGGTAMEKFDKLAERNSFMGGGVAVAFAAYAFLLSGAPRFGFALLILSWLVMSISVWRHRFFENRKHDTAWNVVTCILIGLVLFGTWILLT